MKTTLKFASLFLLGGALAAVGCETSVRSQTAPTAVVPAESFETTPDPVVDPVDRRPGPAKVNVDIGNGRGIHVDVDRDATRRRGADVDVDVGGPNGVRVDVDER